MASSMKCDSCGNEIPNPMDHGMVRLPSTMVEAGPMMDLCGTCCESLLEVPAVQAGLVAFQQRRDEVAAAIAAMPPAEAAPSTSA